MGILTAEREAYTARVRAHHWANREARNALRRADRLAHSEKARAYNAARRDPANNRAWARAWRAKNPGHVRSWHVSRRAAEYQALPAWADLPAIAVIYEAAARITRETGIPHVVDHIYPLRGKNVSGLHVPCNLQILTRVANAKKYNRMP